jgi:hypothetical protein
MVYLQLQHELWPSAIIMEEMDLRAVACGAVLGLLVPKLCLCDEFCVYVFM